MAAPDVTTQFALFINGEIYREPTPATALYLGWFSSSPEPLVFNTKADADVAAERIRSVLRERYHIDPVVTVAHRYCSDWTVQQIGADIVERFEQLLDEEGRQ